MPPPHQTVFDQGNSSMGRQLVSSSSPLEPVIGFSRAVMVGPYVAVSGTAPIGPDGHAAHVGDVYAQTKLCLSIIQQALKSCGCKMESVIRTRIMLTDITSWEEAARAHGDIRRDPARQPHLSRSFGSLIRMASRSRGRLHSRRMKDRHPLSVARRCAKWDCPASVLRHRRLRQRGSRPVPSQDVTLAGSVDVIGVGMRAPQR